MSCMNLKTSFIFYYLWSIEKGMLGLRGEVRPYRTLLGQKEQFSKNSHWWLPQSIMAALEREKLPGYIL